MYSNPIAGNTIGDILTAIGRLEEKLKTIEEHVESLCENMEVVLDSVCDEEEEPKPGSEYDYAEVDAGSPDPKPGDRTLAQTAPRCDDKWAKRYADVENDERIHREQLGGLRDLTDQRRTMPGQHGEESKARLLEMLPPGQRQAAIQKMQRSEVEERNMKALGLM